MKHMEYCISQDQLGCPQFDGSGAVDFFDHVLMKMKEFNLHPLSVLTALQEARWWNSTMRTKLRDMARLEPDAPAFISVDWSDEDCIEKAVIGLDDFILRMLREFVSSTKRNEGNAQKAIAELRMKSPSMLGIQPLFTELRTLYLRLPKEERSCFRVMNRDFEDAIKRTICAEPGKLFSEYIRAKRFAELRLGRLIDDEPTEDKKIKYLAEITSEISQQARDEGLSDGENGNNKTNKRDSRLPDNRSTAGDNRGNTDFFTPRRSQGRGSANDPIRIRQLTEVSNGRDGQEARLIGRDCHEARFARYFSVDTHTTDGLHRIPKELDVECIVCNTIQQVGLGRQSTELRSRVRDQVPLEQRLHCECCGYTGHEVTTCNVADSDGKIDKGTLALADKDRADMRMYAAWTRGGCLNGLSEEQYEAYVREVDSIRARNPAMTPNNRPNNNNGRFGNGSGGRGRGGRFGGGSNSTANGNRFNSGGETSNGVPNYGTRQSYQTGPTNDNTASQSASGASNRGANHHRNGGRGQDNRGQDNRSRPSIYGPGDASLDNPNPNTRPRQPASAPAPEQSPTVVVNMLHQEHRTLMRRAQEMMNRSVPTPREWQQGLHDSSDEDDFASSDCHRSKRQFVDPRVGDSHSEEYRNLMFPTSNQIEELESVSSLKRTRTPECTMSEALSDIMNSISATPMNTQQETSNSPHSSQSSETKRSSPGILVDLHVHAAQVTDEAGDESDNEVAEVITSNKGLVYFDFSIILPEVWNNTELTDSDRDNCLEECAMHVQFDGGAGTSICSPAFVERQGFRPYPRQKPIKVQGFDGIKFEVTHYINVLIHVEGIDIHGQPASRTFSTQALITPECHVDFLLGSNVALDHNIVVIPDERKATIFRGEHKLEVKCIEWDIVQRALADKRLKQQATEDLACYSIQSAGEDESDPHVMLRRRQQEQAVVQIYREELRHLVGAYCEADTPHTIRIAAREIVYKATSNPFQFKRAGKHLYRDRFYLAALVVIAQYLRIPEIADLVTLLDGVFFAHDRCLIGGSQMHDEVQREDVLRAIALVKIMIEVTLFSPSSDEYTTVRVHNCTEVSEEFMAQVTREQEEFDLSMATIAHYKAHIATDCLWEFCPTEFDKELWPLVMDTVKPKVLETYRRFDCDPEYRAEIIATLKAVDISEETRARRAEKPLFLAQILANLDRFAHPSKDNLPTVKGREFVIELKDDDKEPAVARFQRFDAWQTRFLHLKIQKMIAEKRMERSNSEWNARLSLVPYTDRIQKFAEKHGNNVLSALLDDANAAEVMTFFRLTTDLRNLNQKTKPKIYPLPNITDIISQCDGVDRYTTGDICDAFHTVLCAESSRGYTAFSTPGGHFHYCVMPQGSRNAATFWAEMIADIFRTMLERNAPIIVYQDDIGNRAKTLLEHLDIQQEIYDIMHDNYMIFKPSKMHCNFKAQRILGHVLNGEGRVPDPKTLEAVTQLKTPTTLTEVRSVLGLFQYASVYIENMSAIMAPIQALTRKGVDINATWDEKIHGVAFEALKIALTSAPILKIPDINKPFKLETDACRVGRGIGAILSQEDDEGILRPCQYWSRALSNAERRYSATELECLALHDSILHWKVYLSNGHQFECIVDHYALVFMVTRMASSEQTNQRLLRLCLDLQGFNFKVTHRAGIRHIGADAVSRLLRHGEEAYVRSVDDLRDDIGPLTEVDIQRLQMEYSQDAWFLIQTINEHREQERELRLEQESSMRLAMAEAQAQSVEEQEDNDESPNEAVQCHMCNEENDSNQRQRTIGQYTRSAQPPCEANHVTATDNANQSEEDYIRAWFQCKDTDEMNELLKTQSPTKTLRVMEWDFTSPPTTRTIGEHERDLENIIFGDSPSPSKTRTSRRMRHSQECTEALHDEVSKLVRTQQTAGERGRHHWFTMQRQLASEQAVQRELNTANSEDELGQYDQLPMNSSQYRKYVQSYPVSNPQWTNEQLLQMAKFRVEERLRKQQGEEVININMMRLGRPAESTTHNVTPDVYRRPSIVTPAPQQRFISSDDRRMTQTQLRMIHQPRQGPAPMAALCPNHNPTRCLCRASEVTEPNSMCYKCGVVNKPHIERTIPTSSVCDAHRVDFYNKTRDSGICNEQYWKNKWVQATTRQRQLEFDPSCRDHTRADINREVQKCYYLYSKQRQENKKAEQLVKESQHRLQRGNDNQAMDNSPIAKRVCIQSTPPRPGKTSDNTERTTQSEPPRTAEKGDFEIMEHEFEYSLPSQSERKQTDCDLISTFGKRIDSRAQLKSEICQAIQSANSETDIRRLVDDILTNNIDRAMGITNRTSESISSTGAGVTTQAAAQSNPDTPTSGNQLDIRQIPSYLLTDDRQCGAAFIRQTLKKRLAGYSTDALQLALRHTKIVREAKEEIQHELNARQSRKEHPHIGFQPTRQIHEELERLHSSFVNNGWTSTEIARVTCIENELLLRGERNRKKKFDDICAEVLQDRQYGFQEQFKEVTSKARELQKSISPSSLKAHQMIEQDIAQYQQDYVKWQSENSSFHIELPENTCVNEAVEYINTLNNKTRIAVEARANQLRRRLHEAEEGNGRVRVDPTSGDIIIHTLTQHEKFQLRNNSRQQLTETEQATKARLALIQQKNAQQQSIKLQEKRQEAAKRLQRATEARLKKMSALEAELRQLSGSRSAAREEFENEDEDYLIDKRLEDECDCLISQHFLCPTTSQLYEIIDVKLEKNPQSTQRHMVVVARPINSIETGGDRQNITKTFPVADATQWVNSFVAGKRSFEDTPMPTNNAEWVAVQLRDPYCKRVIDALGTDPHSRYPLDGKSQVETKDYLFRDRLSDGTLSPVQRRHAKTRVVETQRATVNIAQHVVQKVIPVSLADKIVWIMHDQMGHPGRNRTMETVRLKFYWPGMYTDIANYCKDCHYCALRKANNRVAKVPIMSYDFSERPNSRVHFDTAGPFPLSNSGSHYILVIKDALTKWVTLIPAYSKDMYTVQRMYLEHWTSKFGAPDVLITDRGSEFHNVVAKQLAELWGVRKISTTPRNPRADGQVENQMRTIKDMLQSYIHANQQDWDEHLSLVAQAYNNTVNDATGMTPYYLMFGTEMNTASEEHTQQMSVKEFHETVHRVKEVQQWLWSYVGNRVVNNSVKYNRVPVERLQFKPYEHGDFFYLRVVPKRVYKNDKEERAHQISAKLQFRYTGPYMVHEQLSPVLYTSYIHGKLKRCHAINMKPANKTKIHSKSNRTQPAHTTFE